MKIAVVQFTIDAVNLEENCQKVSNLIDSEPNCDLYLLPELWTCGYIQEQWLSIAENETPKALTWMSREALRRNILIGGSIIFKESDGGLVNRFMLFDRVGSLICSYDKAHLFKPLSEHEYLVGGLKLPPVVVVDGLRISPAICYDLRFPEMFRRVALKGVDVYLVSSQWPKPRRKILEVLAQARAIENQALLVLSNSIGVDSSGNDFCGGSGFFDPYGDSIQVSDIEGVVVQEVCIDDLSKARVQLRVIDDREIGVDFD